MPPLPAFRVAALRDLAAELRFSGRAALLRQVDRAEALAGEIDGDRAYPQREIVLLLTGYRPEHDDDEAMIPGAAVLMDLSTLAEHLTSEAACTIEDLRGTVLRVDDLMGRWNVSRKTIDRYRRRGLIARRIAGVSGRGELAFTGVAVDTFERLLGAAGKAPRPIDRIGEREHAAILRRAARYRRRFRCSRNQAAQRIAARYGRSQEAVRQVLLRHDKAARDHAKGRPIFEIPVRRDGRTRMAVLRALRRGVEPRDLVALIGSGGATRRQVTHLAGTTRVRLLRRLRLDAPMHADLMGDAVAVSVLADDAARTGLMVGTGPLDLDGLLSLAARTRPETASLENARARAMLVLLHRARTGIAALPSATLRAGPIDAIETDLRWAHRIRSVQVASQLGVLIAALRDSLGAAFDREDPATRACYVAGALRAAGRAVDGHGPFHGGRLAAAVGLSVTRLVAAIRRNDPGTLPALRPEALFDLDAMWPGPSWRAWLAPPTALVDAVRRPHDDEAITLLLRRFGMDGGPPMTLVALSEHRGMPPMHTARRERAALRALQAGG